MVLLIVKGLLQSSWDLAGGSAIWISFAYLYPSRHLFHNKCLYDKEGYYLAGMKHVPTQNQTYLYLNL
jgi:hypothetical protein